MNLLFSCIGKRGYVADYIRPHLRHGERIVGTSHTPWTAGFQSCDAARILPPIASDEYIPAVLDTCRHFDVTGLLSFFDPDVARLAAHRAELVAAGVTPFLPGDGTAALALDKWLTFVELTKLGFQVPRSFIALDAVEAALADGSLAFPLVVKPRRGFGSAATFVAHDEAQLRAFFAYAPDMLVQAFVDGDEYNTSVLSDLQGRVLSVVPCRKLLMGGGETQQAITVEYPGLLELAARVAEAIDGIGPLDIDFLQDQSGALHVLDLNPRFGGTYPLAQLAGADFPGLIVRLLRGETLEPRIGDYARDVCMVKAIAVAGGPADTFLDVPRHGVVA